MDAAGLLRSGRRCAGLSQHELAERAGTSQATISAYENGRKVPSVATLSRLLAACGSRLAVEPGPRPTTQPTRARHARTARALADVMALADALPSRHEPRLRYPRLPGPSA